MSYENMDKETLVEILRHKDNMLNELYQEKDKLNYYANIDPMTGLLNRRSGLELLDKEFNSSKLYDSNLIVCFVDVDGLKIINDNFGHGEGDKLLINVAQILKESIRKTDFVIRMGGDEFLIAFTETVINEANKAWARILKKLEDINKNNEKYNLSLSYGFYEYSKKVGKKLTINELIKKADVEMYKVKSEKRRNYAINVEKNM